MNRAAQSVCATAFLFTSLSGAVEQTAENKDFVWVQARVDQIAVKPDERPLDQIGWAKDIRDAKRLAKESGRPVFLFTHDGRLNIGRC